MILPGTAIATWVPDRVIGVALPSLGTKLVREGRRSEVRPTVLCAKSLRRSGEMA
jgi:hypothetical protein